MSPSIPQRPYKRRIIVIKKDLQYKFVFLVLACVAASMAAIAADVFQLLRGLEAGGSAEAAAGVFGDFRIAFLSRAVLYMTGVVVVALLVSHKIAGPLYRFERAMEDICKGDLSSRVFLRAKDELGEIRDHFNDMVASLQVRLVEDKERAARAEQALRSAAADPAAPSDVADKIRQALAELKDIGKGFKLS
jgi:nitrogen fixation/metabolism regulation signal transduction histidine kinase